MTDAQLMTWPQRREARVALAMLPVGATILIVSALAFVAVVLLAVATPFRGGPWLDTLMWALVAAAVSVRNAVAGIAIMSAFDWRPVPFTLLLSGLIVAAYPGWLFG